MSDHMTLDDIRQCWICYGSEPIPQGWISPCKCRGTAKYVHSRCLQRWIDEKQKHNPSATVKCSLCSHPYHIEGPNLGFIMNGLDLSEKFINKACPFAALLGLLGSAYWSAVTYGAVTVLQVLGHKEGQAVMEQADPLFLLIGLPAIPMVLVGAKLIPWEEFLVRLWRKYSHKLLGSLNKPDDKMWMASNDVAEDRIQIPYSRLIVGALVFPTISTLTGKLLFGNVKSNLQRSVLGGFAYFMFKGLLRMYYMEMNYRRRSQRKIVDYDDSTN